MMRLIVILLLCIALMALDPISIEIIATDCTDSIAMVQFETSYRPGSSDADWVEFWRSEKWPFFRNDDFRETYPACKIDGRMETDSYFFDYFTDTHWHTYCSRGVGDPDVNYFYSAIAVDSVDSMGEMDVSYPSNCVAEFDQRLCAAPMGNFNILSYPVDHGYSTLIEIGEDIPTAIMMQTYSDETGDWNTVAQKVGGSWIPFGDIDVALGDVFGVVLDGSESEVIFSTYSPGNIVDPGDCSRCISYSGTWMVVPPSYSYELRDAVVPRGDNLYYRHLAEDIGRGFGEEVSEIRVWEPRTQTMLTVAYYAFPVGWVLNIPVTPGRPMFLRGLDDSSTPWPPTS